MTRPVTETLQKWADSDRKQADAIRWFNAVGADNARESLSAAQAETLEAAAQGWEALIDAIEKSDGTVEDPDA